MKYFKLLPLIFFTATVSYGATWDSSIPNLGTPAESTDYIRTYDNSQSGATATGLRFDGINTHYLNGQGEWVDMSGAGLGDVTGPSSATDQGLVIFDGASGKVVKEASNWSIDANGYLLGPGYSTTSADGERYTQTVNSNGFTGATASLVEGANFYDQTLNKFQLWDGSAWGPFPGTISTYQVTLTDLGTAATEPDPSVIFEVPEDSHWIDGKLVCSGTQTIGTADGLLTVVDESFTSAFDVAVALANQNIQTSPVPVVTSSDGLTTYAEGTDYTIDYVAGTITVLSTGTMADATAYLIDYTYQVTNYATLVDSTATWTVDAFVGAKLVNETDGSSCVITANSETTATCTLVGGTENDWDVGDSYRVYSDTSNLQITVAYAASADGTWTAYTTTVGTEGSIDVSGWADPAVGTNISAWVNTASTGDATWCKVITRLY